MYLVYFDDTIFASSSIDDLEQDITSLGINSSVQRHTFALRNEGEVCAFFGIHIKKVTQIEFILTQSGLTDKILLVTGMTDCNGYNTPASLDPLHTNSNGSPFSEEWSYATVIGMLTYLSGNTRPNIAYAVPQAA